MRLDHLLFTSILTSFIAIHCYAETPIVTNKMLSVNQKARLLQFNWDKIYIGSAEYPDAPTGCTVFYFPDRNLNAIADIRGADAASFYTNAITQGVNKVDAIVFSGGSLLGLESVAGVEYAIFNDRKNKTNGIPTIKIDNTSVSSWRFIIPSVTGSVINDWNNRNSPLYPNKKLGALAYQNAETGKFILGQHGAGINATVAKLFGRDYSSKGGQGGALEQFGELKIAVFVVVNSLGAIYNAEGQVIHGYFDKKTNKQLTENDLLLKNYPFGAKDRTLENKGNTTLSLIVVNVDLNLSEMRAIARQVHNSFGEVIRPYGTQNDGDTLYFVSTKEIQIPEKERSDALLHLGMLATKVVKKAVFSAFD